MSKLQVELRMMVDNYWVVVGLKDTTISRLYIPDKVDGYDVRNIASNAFANNTNLTYVNMPETIRYIGEGAFRGCTNLEQVYRHHSHYGTLIVDAKAFYMCENLTNIYLNRLIELGHGAFAGCTKLSEFPFDECKDVKAFRKKTFASTRIQKVTLHSQRISKKCFYNTPVDEVFIKGQPTWSEDFFDVLKTAQVFVPPKSTFLDLGFHGIYVEERIK